MKLHVGVVNNIWIEKYFFQDISFQKNLKKASYLTPTGYRRHGINGIAIQVLIQVLRNLSGQNLHLFLWEEL